MIIKSVIYTVNLLDFHTNKNLVSLLYSRYLEIFVPKISCNYYIYYNSQPKFLYIVYIEDNNSLFS